MKNKLNVIKALSLGTLLGVVSPNEAFANIDKVNDFVSLVLEKSQDPTTEQEKKQKLFAEIYAKVFKKGGLFSYASIGEQHSEHVEFSSFGSDLRLVWEGEQFLGIGFGKAVCLLPVKLENLNSFCDKNEMNSDSLKEILENLDMLLKKIEAEEDVSQK